MAEDDLQTDYDDAVYAYTTGDFASAIAGFEAILHRDPAHFEALLSLSLAHYRLGDFPRAIEVGHQAEAAQPSEQRVHTNLSLFYMKHGDKKTAEHHGLQARIASWRGNMAKPDPNATPSPPAELQMAETPKPAAPPAPKPTAFPDMPWKKNKPLASGDNTPPK